MLRGLLAQRRVARMGPHGEIDLAGGLVVVTRFGVGRGDRAPESGGGGLAQPRRGRRPAGRAATMSDHPGDLSAPLSVCASAFV